jgi:hypothetical protein
MNVPSKAEQPTVKNQDVDRKDRFYLTDSIPTAASNSSSLLKAEDVTIAEEHPDKDPDSSMMPEEGPTNKLDDADYEDEMAWTEALLDEPVKTVKTPRGVWTPTLLRRLVELAISDKDYRIPNTNTLTLKARRIISEQLKQEFPGFPPEKLAIDCISAKWVKLIHHCICEFKPLLELPRCQFNPKFGTLYYELPETNAEASDRPHINDEIFAAYLEVEHHDFLTNERQVGRYFQFDCEYFWLLSKWVINLDYTTDNEKSYGYENTKDQNELSSNRGSEEVNSEALNKENLKNVPPGSIASQSCKGLGFLLSEGLISSQEAEGLKSTLLGRGRVGDDMTLFKKLIHVFETHESLNTGHEESKQYLANVCVDVMRYLIQEGYISIIRPEKYF